jgi:hypothetical protein
VVVLREYLVKSRRFGDSIVLVLPKELLVAEKIEENMDLVITIKKLERRGSLFGEDPWRLLE